MLVTMATEIFVSGQFPVCEYDIMLLFILYKVIMLVCSFVRSFNRSFVRSFVHLFVHSFVRSFDSCVRYYHL